MIIIAEEIKHTKVIVDIETLEKKFRDNGLNQSEIKEIESLILKEEYDAEFTEYVNGILQGNLIITVGRHTFSIEGTKI